MSRDIMFWDLEEAERLIYEDQDEAIEYILDGMESIDSLPKTIEICGYARMDLPRAESLTSHVLDHILEGLDEDHGNPEGSYSEATDTMKDAATVFVTAVLDGYTSWACEVVERKTIDVPVWIKANRPDWIDGQGQE